MVWWTCSYVHVRVVRSGKIEHQESRLVLIMCNLGTWSNLLFEETLQYATLPSKSQTSPLCVCWSNESQSLRKTRGKAEAAATPLLKDMALVSELGPLKKYEILYDYRGIKGFEGSNKHLTMPRFSLCQFWTKRSHSHWPSPHPLHLVSHSCES